MSWGGGEFYGQTAYDSYFTTPAGHQGVTFVAAAGDSGAQPPSGRRSRPTSCPSAARRSSFPAPAHTKVKPPGAAAAADTAADRGGAGISERCAITGVRSVPDVAWDANPNTGVAVYDSINDEGYVGWQEVGGTSVGAPSWAGVIAIADQARGCRLARSTASTRPCRSFTRLQRRGQFSTYTTRFNDITSGGGNTGGFGFGRGRFGGPSSSGAPSAMTPPPASARPRAAASSRPSSPGRSPRRLWPRPPPAAPASIPGANFDSAGAGIRSIKLTRISAPSTSPP